MDLLESVDGELADTQKAALSGALCALPGETAEGAAITLGTSCKTVGSAIGQLLTAAANVDDNYVGLAARHIANAVKVGVDCVCVWICVCMPMSVFACSCVVELS